MTQGEAEVDGVKWRALVEQKYSRGNLQAAFGADQILRNMWEPFRIKKVWARTVWRDAPKVTQLGTVGRWQHASSYKEELKLLRHSTDMRFDGSQMRKAYKAGKSGDCEKFFEKMADSAHGKA